jgi:hypothetical protein
MDTRSITVSPAHTAGEISQIGGAPA